MSNANELRVTRGTSSWNEGVNEEHELLAGFLEEVAATETIKSAINHAVNRMRPQLGIRVLDVGCGTGVFFPAIAGAIGTTGMIAGVDHAAGFLDDARQRSVAEGMAAQVELVLGDAHDLPFQSGSFDAAHTERVLMHLNDPDRAIRELCRVVRPGGWVVCVEPDLSGMCVDHEDPDLVERVVEGFCASIQNPSMGLELNRRFAQAGLEARSIDVLTEVERDYPDDVAEFFRRSATTAIQRGWITEQEATLTLAKLKRAGELGCYTSYSSMFVVAGRVPVGSG